MPQIVVHVCMHRRLASVHLCMHRQLASAHTTSIFLGANFRVLTLHTSPLFSGTCISPCGNFLAVCLPPTSGEEDARSTDEAAAHQSGGDPMSVDGEERSRHGEIAIISLKEESFAKQLCKAPIPKSAKITCVRFSSSCRYLLVGYGEP